MFHALEEIEKVAISLGYRQEAIHRNYQFADFGSGVGGASRNADLAVFTRTPTNYRTAAFGVFSAMPGTEEDVARDAEFLGAPVIFTCVGERITQWKVVHGQRPEILGEESGPNAAKLFFGELRQWSPDAIHRAKAIGRFEPSFQLSFVDSGLLSALEGKIHTNIDALLRKAMKEGGQPDTDVGSRLLFTGVFRLLAAKILVDRGHVDVKVHLADDAATVVRGIEQYYRLPAFSANQDIQERLARIWDVIRVGLNVRNVSADDLAYVYENTLVTPATRESFGTHSTPREIAEFVVSKLDLWKPTTSPPLVYEPFTGAGVFLVAALQKLRDSLPSDWTDREKHDVLVTRIFGDERDPFAAEVASLSLILADYPNTNGWRIRQVDLFNGLALRDRLDGVDVVLCNPPFEAFSKDDRSNVPDLGNIRGKKAELALKLVLEAKPKALGFVLPRAFLEEDAYFEHRKAIESRFRDIDIVSLPDRVFRVSKVETALLIAKNPGVAGEEQTIRSSVVNDSDRVRFLTSWVPSALRCQSRLLPSEPTGKIWIHQNYDLWYRLQTFDRLGKFADCHWGMRWKDKYQSKAWSSEPKVGSEEGLMRSNSLVQFGAKMTGYLDVSQDKLYGGSSLPYHEPKVVMNAARRGRGPWQYTAMVDRSGLRLSQQFSDRSRLVPRYHRRRLQEGKGPLSDASVRLPYLGRCCQLCCQTLPTLVASHTACALIHRRIHQNSLYRLSPEDHNI